MNKNQPTNSPARENQLDFLYDLYSQGIDIGNEGIALLKRAEYIDGDIPKEVKRPQGRPPSFVDHSVKNKKETHVDRFIDIESESLVEPDDTVLYESEYKKHVYLYGSQIYTGQKVPISRKDWMPESTMQHDKAFVNWIDSMNFVGFKSRARYGRLNMYVQQCDDWISQGGSVAEQPTPEAKEEYKDREIERGTENTMYFLNKYLKLKEGDMASGARDYDAKECHEIICYLFDCGYSFYLGKPRQIAATSTLGGCGLKKIIFNRNFFLKFVTQDAEKGEEIFEDKIKYPFSELPEWMKPDVKNDRDRLFALGYKDKKGDREGVNSKLQVVAPSKTAISGGSPQLSFIDEAGNIPILTAIIEDANPTMYWMNPKTGKMEMKRQMIVWGTGGDMEKGGKAFEREFMACIRRWQARKFNSGIIPLFFDWSTRPGITQEFYDEKKEEFYSKEGPDAEDSRVMFQQQYPSSIEDMFLSSSKTIVSQEYINSQLDRIRKHSHVLRPKRGYFEAILGDKSMPEGADIPFNIIGVDFVAVPDGDPRGVVIMFQEPKKNWRKRYYQGTDPIASDTGLSNMASGIWDNYYKTVSCVVNFRATNYKETFLQTMLLGMYYDIERGYGVKELLETNIGLAYREYKENKGFFDSLVFNAELPQYLQTSSGNIVGIDNRGMRSKMIIDKMFEMIQAFGTKIYIEEFFIQLKTFVCTVNQKGNESWGPVDRRYYKDDVLFACVFSYICSLCYINEIPEKIDSEDKRTVIRHELRRDANWNLTRVPVRKRIS